VVAVFVCAFAAQAQPVSDAQSSVFKANTTAGLTLTVAHTTGANLNRYMLVAVAIDINPNNAAAVTAVTYNGTALTFVGGVNDGVPNVRLEMWQMVNPPTGTFNVVTTMNAASANCGVTVGVSTYSNAAQTASLGVGNSASGNSNNPAVTLNGTLATDLVIDAVSARGNNTLTATAGQTQLYNLQSGVNGGDSRGAGSTKPGGGNVTTSWTSAGAGANHWVDGIVNLRVATADMAITTSTPSPDPVMTGQQATWTLTVTNNGASFAGAVTTTDPAPAGWTIVSATPSVGSCTAGTVNCALGTMASGATATITVVATTGGATLGTINSTATVATTTTDPTAANNTATVTTVVESDQCGNPGAQGAGGNITGVINAYWPGTQATVAVNAKTVTIGARTGAANTIAIGDLLVIMQMQDAAIDFADNDERYGSGTGTAGGTTNPGRGATNLNSSGRYEYILATNAVGAAGGTLNFTSAGSTQGLLYSYNNAAASGTQGQRRYQIIRVPQYTTATLTSGLTALAWNGTTGGVLVCDVAGTLTLNSATVSVNGLGFRGAATQQRAGGGGANTDYVNTDANAAHGTKGEGIAGTPQYLYVPATDTVTDSGAQGYPGGDFARGAPGNAGGGGTDGNPAANDENSGGGGGGNGGIGGQGGNSWNSNLPVGGWGGANVAAGISRVVMGGSGGAGSRNNDPGVNGSSAGANGGGIVLIRAGNMSGSAAITANGSAAFQTTLNDGGGGGGAGGTVVVLVRGTGIGGLTVNANGGRGGDAWITQPPAGTPGERHGPGGGGAGGVIILSSVGPTTAVTGGAAGQTTTALDNYNATAGALGIVIVTTNPEPGVGSGAHCSPDVAVTISDAPDPVSAGNQITYTINVTNNGTVAVAPNPSWTLVTPAGTTFASVTPPAGWTCPTTPAVGGTGTITCSSVTALGVGATTPNFSLVLNTPASTVNGTVITASVTASTTATDPIPANNTASTTTTVVRRVDVSIVKSGAPDPIGQNQPMAYTLVVTNNGPSNASGVTVSDPLPGVFTFSSVSTTVGSCSQAAGTVTCTLGSMIPGATGTITINGTMNSPPNIVTNTATVTQNETDTNVANNSSSFDSAVVTATQVHMLSMSAQQDQEKVVVSWTTSFEQDNLGFNVYRQFSGGSMQKVNEHLIAGSAVTNGHKAVNKSSSYSWKDENVDNGKFVQYYLEDIDLHGVRTMNGPVTPGLVGSIPDGKNTDTIADLGSAGGIFNSPDGIGAPKYTVSTPTKTQIDTQYDLAGQPSIKLMVTQEGWYRVTRRQLSDAGFDPGSNSSLLSLFQEGVEQPMSVADGGDGRFDPDDALEFYGTGIDTPSSGARAYWLVSMKGRAVRVGSDKTKKSASFTGNVPFTFESKERTNFIFALTNNGDRENFYGATLSNAGATQNIKVSHADPAGGNATLEVAYQGGTDGIHDIRTVLGGHDLGIAHLTGQQRLVKTFAVPVAWLTEGANTLSFTALGNDDDLSLLESVRLTYPHLLSADRDALKFTVAAGRNVTVDGFTTKKIRAFDITDPMSVTELGVDVAPKGSGFAATIGVGASNGNGNGNDDGNGNGNNGNGTSSATRTILMTADTRVLAPAQLLPSRASAWNAASNKADMVIIAARPFMAAAAPLKSARDAQGISTQIIDVQDLYDEFGFGQRGPQPIKDFLARSKSWKTVPRYMLLLGDATFDPRNYYNLGTFDFVPTKLVNTAEMKTASDDWLSDFNNDGIADVATGRIPARTAAEAATMINKIVGRDASSQNVTLVAGVNKDYNFENAASLAAALVPASVPKNTIKVASTPDPHGAVVSALNAGPSVVDYLGHGSVDVWEGFFGGGDASTLTNGRKLPFVVTMTCLNGFFHDVYLESLAEVLLKNPNGGASAVWASSSLTEPAGQSLMNQELFRQIYSNNSQSLGEAVLKAKKATTDQNVRKSWIFFGDPSMKLH
jgi:uncharacterized repeat protein (TIGR01451 family)